MPAQSPLRRRAALLAAALFGVEVVIATEFAHWPFVRGTLGDVLVVVLIYAVALIWRPFPPGRLALLVFGFACCVEAAQACDVAGALGLVRGGVGETVVGSTAAWSDVLAYAVGCLAARAVDPLLRRTSSTLAA